MNSQHLQHDESPDDRWRKHAVYLEELLCHEQEAVRQLNEIVVGLRDQTDRLQNKVEILEAKFQFLLRNPEAGDNLPNEKPPHY